MSSLSKFLAVQVSDQGFLVKSITTDLTTVDTVHVDLHVRIQFPSDKHPAYVKSVHKQRGKVRLFPGGCCAADHNIRHSPVASQTGVCQKVVGDPCRDLLTGHHFTSTPPASPEQWEIVLKALEKSKSDPQCFQCLPGKIGTSTAGSIVHPIHGLVCKLQGLHVWAHRWRRCQRMIPSMPLSGETLRSLV